MEDGFIWAMHLRLGSVYEPVNPTDTDGRYLGDSTRVDWERADGRVRRMAAAGMNTLLLELGEAMEFSSLPKAHLRGQVKAAEINEHVRAWRKLGIETVPVVEFSAVHSEWMGEYSRMPATPPYREKCADVLREAYDVLEKPKYVHVGMADETGSYAHRHLALFRRKEVLWHDLKLFSDTLTKLGARPWMWGDVVWADQEGFKGNLPKEYLVSYRWMVNVVAGGKIPEEEAKWIETFDALESAGYDQVPTCSTSAWYQRGVARSVETVLNPPHVAQYVRTHVSAERLKGLCCFAYYLPDETGDKVQRQTCDIFGKVRKGWQGPA